MEYSAFYECFAVHARNLYYFVTNKDKDSQNFSAEDFIRGFRVPSTGMDQTIRRINNQVFHLGKGRPIAPKEKVPFGRVREIGQWIENI